MAIFEQQHLLVFEIRQRDTPMRYARDARKSFALQSLVVKSGDRQIFPRVVSIGPARFEARQSPTLNTTE